MNYNIVVIISIIICAIISWIFSYYLTLFVLGQDSAFFKIAQLIIVITSMTTFYAPIKHILIKFMNLDEEDEREKNE